MCSFKLIELNSKPYGWRFLVILFYCFSWFVNYYRILRLYFSVVGDLSFFNLYCMLCAYLPTRIIWKIIQPCTLGLERTIVPIRSIEVFDDNDRGGYQLGLHLLWKRHGEFGVWTISTTVHHFQIISLLTGIKGLKTLEMILLVIVLAREIFTTLKAISVVIANLLLRWLRDCLVLFRARSKALQF